MGVVAALAKLRDVKDPNKLAVELAESYPEAPELEFLNPDPLAEVEAHLKA